LDKIKGFIVRDTDYEPYDAVDLLPKYPCSITQTFSALKPAGHTASICVPQAGILSQHASC